MTTTDMLPMGSRTEVHIDWVTLTFPPGSKYFEGRARTIRNMMTLMEREERSGFLSSKWSATGYKGYQCGGVKVGWRNDSCIVVLSGATAPKVMHMPDLEEARCTRLDISTTTWWEEDRPDLMELATAATVKFKETFIGRPYVVDPRRPEPGSKTLYIGTRGKGLFIRVYDKQEESADNPAYRGAWRIEAELAKDTANEAFHELRLRGFAAGAIGRLAAAAYAARGLRLAGWEDYGRLAVVYSQQADTDAGRKLNWLDRTVSPSVKWLISEVGLQSVLEALGLAESFETAKGGT